MFSAMPDRQLPGTDLFEGNVRIRGLNDGWDLDVHAELAEVVLERSDNVSLCWEEVIETTFALHDIRSTFQLILPIASGLL